jgi:hypothetical protein|tara:strand:- start:96 stop:443 length:348 start_codon:yes stop_codon:yes gene_type:complete
MSSSSLFHAWSSSKKVVVDIKESPSKTVVSKSISNWNLETRDELDPITSLGSNPSKKKREEDHQQKEEKKRQKRTTTQQNESSSATKKASFTSSYLRVVHELGVAVPGGDCHVVG